MLLCYLRVHFHQLVSPPVFHVTHIPKGNLIYIPWVMDCTHKESVYLGENVTYIYARGAAATHSAGSDSPTNSNRSPPRTHAISSTQQLGQQQQRSLHQHRDLPCDEPLPAEEESLPTAIATYSVIATSTAIATCSAIAT